MNTNLEAWLDDLETTTDPQGRGVLTNGTAGDCCLGRLCKVAIRNGVNLLVDYDEYWGYTTYNGERAAPPMIVREWAGIDHALVNDCIQWNDKERLSFGEIAKRIRQREAS